MNSADQRRKNIIITGVLTGLVLSVSGDFVLFIAQRCLNWLVLHGFAGGISAVWSGGSGPISIMTSPITILLMALAGATAGLGVGIFAAALLPGRPNDPAQLTSAPGMAHTSKTAE